MTTFRGMFVMPSIAMMLAATTFSCTSSNFGGNGATKGASLDSSRNDGKQGADASDASDGELGNSDRAADLSDVGGNDLGGRDTDVPGADSSDSAGGGGSEGEGDNGGEDGDGDSPEDQDDGKDRDNDKDNDDAGDDDDDETLAKTKYGATITRILADDSFDLKIEVLVSGKVLNTATLSFDEGDKGESKTAAAVCRAGKNTCMRLTFTNTDGSHGGHVETAGVTPCVFVQESGTTATVDVDTNGGEGGGAHQGTCKPGEDDQIAISCPNSKKLQVQACGN